MPLTGIKTHPLKRETLAHTACPGCSATDATEITVLGIYRHLFRIPFVSRGKRGKSVCRNCGRTCGLDEMPDQIKLAYFELKETCRNPFWFYSGLVMIKLLIIIRIFTKYM